MSNSGPQASTKGESTSTTNTTTTSSSSKTTKSGYDHLDINKLYKGKSSEPVAKTVTQKHGMQTLGKAPPARRPGNISSIKTDSTDTSNPNSVPSTPSNTTAGSQQLLPGQLPGYPQQGWTNSSMPHPGPGGSPSPHNAFSAPPTGIPPHEKNWKERQFPSPRFAQEFPSLASEEANVKGTQQSANVPSQSALTGPNSMSKQPLDNQYGPGPLLRPQTEGSWTRGGGQQRGGPPPPNAPQGRELERSNMGGPTPPPMSLGQGGPPSLGGYYGIIHPPPYMFPNGPPPPPGGFPPGPRYGMAIPGIPPNHPSSEVYRDRGGRGGGPNIRPGSHFTAKPIIKPEDLERMDDIITHDGGWASTNDDIDYNKKINFSDDEEERRAGGGDRNNSNKKHKSEKKDRSSNVPPPPLLITNREDDRRPIKILERQSSINEKERDSQQQQLQQQQTHQRYETGPRPNRDYENTEEYWNKGGDRRVFENKGSGSRVRPRDDSDWRSGMNRYEEENNRNNNANNINNKKVPPPTNVRNDPRSAEFSSNRSNNNIPPRFQKQLHQPQQQQQQPPLPAASQNLRQTPSPGSNKDYRDRDWDSNRPPSRDMNIKILERRRGDSDSSREGNRDTHRDRRNNDFDSRGDKDGHNKNSRYGSDRGAQSDFQREKGNDGEEIKNNSSSSKLDSKQQTDSNNRKSEEINKTSYNPSIISWADEVDDDEAHREAEQKHKAEIQKRIQLHAKPEEPKGPKRVYIQQTKVGDMRSSKVEPPPTAEQKQAIEQLNKTDKQVGDKSKSASVWGGERSKQEKESSPQQQNSPQQQQQDNEGTNSENENRRSSEKEIPQQSQQKYAQKQSSQEIEKSKTAAGGLMDKDRKDNNKFDQKQNSGSGNNKNNNNIKDNRELSGSSGGSRGEKHSNNNNNRDNNKPQHQSQYHQQQHQHHSSQNKGPPPRRHQQQWDNFDNRRENNNRMEKDHQRMAADERDRSENGQFYDKEGVNKKNLLEKSRSGDKINESIKGKDSYSRERNSNSERDSSKGSKEKLDLDSKHKESSNKDKQDSDHEGRGQKGNNKGRERGGYPVYQPRSGWSSDSNRRGGGGGGNGGNKNRGRGGGGNNSSQYYDRPVKRIDGDQYHHQENVNKVQIPLSSSDFEQSHSSGGEYMEKDKNKSNENILPLNKNELSSSKEEDIGKKDAGALKAKKDSKENDAALKKGGKSPNSNRKNQRNKLQGYGPPSDKNPFGPPNTSKQLDEGHSSSVIKDKRDELQTNKPTLPLSPGSGPVPLMDLGEISPPTNLQRLKHNRDRERGGGFRDSGMSGREGGGGNGSGGGRSAVPPRMQKERGRYGRGGGSGGNDGRNKKARSRSREVKPLMSINNDYGEWEDVSESDGENKKSSLNKNKNESTSKAPGAEKRLHQNQNQNRSCGTIGKPSNNSTCSDPINMSAAANQQELTNNNNNNSNKNLKPQVGINSKSPTNNNESSSNNSGLNIESSMNSNENIGGDCDSSSGGFQEVKNKKNFVSKEKGFTAPNNNNNNNNNNIMGGNVGKPVTSSSTSSLRNSEKGSKAIRIKNPPYEANRSIAPRFAKSQQQRDSQTPSSIITGSEKNSDTSTLSGNDSYGVESTHGNAWEKPIGTSLRQEQSSNQSSLSKTSSSQIIESKDSIGISTSKLSSGDSRTVGHKISPASNQVNSLLDEGGNSGPVQTMIFENTNFKSGVKFSSVTTNKNNVSNKITEMKKENPLSTIDLGKDLPITFGKTEDSPELDFNSSPFDDHPSNSQTSNIVSSMPMTSHSTSKSISLPQSRAPYQPSPISPLAADLNEKIQSVKRVWDPPMPSLKEHNTTSVCSSDDNSFHSGFGSDSFKSAESSSRDFGTSLQSTVGSNQFGPVSSSTISAIAKPDSSLINSTIRQIKPPPQQQPSVMEGQISSSPFGNYNLHQGGSNAFGAVPSPPTVLGGSVNLTYGANQPIGHLQSGGGYQVFPSHVEGSQVLNSGRPSQFGQYNANPANPTGQPYSMFLTSMESPYQSLSYQQHHPPPNQAVGQPPNQQSRISPGPLTSSGGGNLMINSSTNSLMSLKTQQGSSGNHPQAQQGYSHSQLGHHHQAPTAISHPHNHQLGPIGAIGPNKGYNGGMTAQSQQVFIPYDPNHPNNQVLGLNQSYMSGGMRTAQPPPGTPPIQNPNFYQASNQTGMYPGSQQQLHAVARPINTPQFHGIPFQPINMQGYNSQAAATVSALNLSGNAIVRNTPPGYNAGKNRGKSHFNQ